jgi:hypothetical protein
MRLTADNYYSTEANMAFWSASTVKSFLSCPAAGLAEMTGNWTRPDSDALLIGSYVDAALEGTLGLFIQEHPELFKRDGGLKAQYAKADEMVRRAMNDPVFCDFLRGEKQKIVTGELFGYPFKAKFDVYLPGERIVDVKTVKDLQPVYKPGQGRLDFATAWNWPLQMAIYQALEGNRLPCYLAVITKENPPDIEIVQIEQSRLDAELEYLEKIMPRLDAVKSGVIEPDRCGHCAYCRATKRISGATPLTYYEME